jgi:hypothetical protein
MTLIIVPPFSPQNFSIPAGYNEVITFDVNPAVTPSLQGTTIGWRVYEEAIGIPFGPPILVKSSTDGSIVGLDSPLSFTVQMYSHDTIALLRNYYHEATIVNALGETIGGSFGIMTVIETMNR